MPSSITHQLVAEETLKRLPPNIASIIQAASDEYYLGSQGPDFLFFYRIGSKKEYNLGKFLHRYRVFDTFQLFRRVLIQEKEDCRIPHLSSQELTQAAAYIFGYITHYCTDGTFHPFVYNYLERTQGKKFAHQQVENDWDVYFLRQLRGKENEKFVFAFSPKKIMEHKTTARIFDYLATNLDREEVKTHKFNGGVKNFNRYLKFFHKKCYKSHKRWARAEKLFGGKKFLSSLYPRENPDSACLQNEFYLEDSNGRGRNADELFELAVSDSVNLIERFFQSLHGEELSREQFGKGLLTGEVL